MTEVKIGFGDDEDHSEAPADPETPAEGEAPEADSAKVEPPAA